MWIIIFQKLKKYWYIVALILILVLSFFLTRKKTDLPIQPGQATSKPVAQSSTPPLSTTSVYFINSIATQGAVLGYSWHGNTLFYITRAGIYEAGKTTALVTKNITDVSYSANGQFIYKDQTRWYYYNTKDKKEIVINSNANKLEISPGGNFIAFTNISTLNLISVSDNTTENLSFDAPIQNIVWSYDEKFLAVMIPRPSNNEVKIIETNAFKETTTKSFNKGSSLKAMSPTGNITVVQVGNELQFVSNLATRIIQLQNTAESSFTWTNKVAIMVQTVSDNIGRKINYIYKVDPQYNSLLLTNTKAIPRKIDPNHHFYLNESGNVIVLIERQSTIWLLSLTPNVFPFYDNEGLGFFDPPKAAHED